MAENNNPYRPVSAAPVKSFFVSMLTRDIRLEEAILDLLDNCVDGILRSKQTEPDKPYEGNWAEISFEDGTFVIADNCGGIPWSLSQYAFRMGRDPNREQDAKGIVGVYGIGMKRAIFKIGKSCEISTRSGNDEYEVTITPEWVDDENDWEIPVSEKPTSMIEDGTTIVVGDLHPGIASRLEEDRESFQNELMDLISSHYALIIDKGLRITVNGTLVKSRWRGLLFADTQTEEERAIQPFIYKARTEKGVDVFLTVGFTGPIPSEDEALDEQEEKQRSTEEAGWTVICNDRAVLYCDRTELTGWGEAGIPRYHTQFIAVSGIVEFKSDNPGELPTTTTKRGVDASSVLYLQVKNKMRDGMKLFTDYTNQWKGRTEEIKSQFAAGTPLALSAIKERSTEIKLSPTTRSIPGASQYRPPLPKPERRNPRSRRISFTKEVDEVAMVAEHLFGDPRTRPSEVGEKCFDILLQEASR